MRSMAMAAICAASALMGVCPSFAADSAPATPDPAQWRALDPANTLYMDTERGRIVIEMFPEAAPKAVERIKTLAQMHFYDGLAFHRVVSSFMAQGGDPLGTGMGGSKLPPLPAEFLFRRGKDMAFVEAASQGGAKIGFYKTLPMQSQPDEMMAITKDGKAAAWGLHCAGIAAMAHDGNSDNSANSQFYLMRSAYPSLDKRYAIWGRVVWGLDLVRAIPAGEPPPVPDHTVKVRVASDLPEAERAPLYVQRTDSASFRELINEARKARGADFSACDIEIPVRVSGIGADKPEKERPWWKKIPLIP